MFRNFLQNHVLANLVFVLVLVMGVSSYLLIPRAQDPSINFNWIDITTLYPGASTRDVEKEITNVIEDAVRKVSDIKFVSSASREGISSLLIRFDEITGRTFEKRVADVIQAKEPATQLVKFNRQPSVLFNITKQEKENILQLVERISEHIDDNQPIFKATGVTVTLVDDQTQITRDALKTMQTNATLGLIMVLTVTWIFLGAPIALLTGIAIPFILAGVFWFLNSIGQTLNVTVLLGIVISLGMLVDATYSRSPDTIRHFNYRRNITVEADIDKEMTNEIKANQMIREFWQSIHHRYPNIDLDFSGIIDDIQESLSAIGLLFLLGLGLIYLILGTQFQSYFQPFLIIMTIPMAATGVVLGLLVSQYPLSLFSLYGIVALAGIAVNAAIVLISTANARLKSGMSTTNAIIYASRRRVIPILITSLTTIAGLFSLATGLGGESLLWGPVAASMVWGLTVSTILTLFYIPLLYRLFMRPWESRREFS